MMRRLVPFLSLVLACSGTSREPISNVRQESALIIGVYSYMADAATFTRCGTDVRVPVATEGASLALEKAYLAAPHEPGEAMLVTLEGRFETRPPMEGAPREHLIVDRFDAVWPGETCQKTGVETTLRNTYWKLVELNGAPVHTQEGQREVHLSLRMDAPSVRGFAGCNMFEGTYALDGTKLRFEKLVATLTACPFEEAAYLAALETVSTYRILGETLVLFGDAGQVARFRAVYF
jgi:heat shock protein HslJ